RRTGVGCRDTLPAALMVATPSGLSGSCGGGTITATPGSSIISLAGATLGVGGSCTFSVNVTAILPGVATNTSGNVTSNEGGTGNTAPASITILGPDLTLSISKAGNFAQSVNGVSLS